MGLRVAIDLDGVLANSIARWIEIWNENRYPKISYESVTKWDFWKDLGITQKEFEKIFREVWMNWEEVEPMEENLAEKIEMLGEFGKIDVVTGRPMEDREFVVKWLDAHGISYSNLVIALKKKSEYPYDLFIDDSPLIAREVSSTGRLVFLRDQPWNRSVRGSRLVIRVHSLDAAIAELRTLASNHDPYKI